MRWWGPGRAATKEREGSMRAVSKKALPGLRDPRDWVKKTFPVALFGG